MYACFVFFAGVSMSILSADVLQIKILKETRKLAQKRVVHAEEERRDIHALYMHALMLNENVD